MDVLVSDTSVLIDLERGRFLEAIFQLPYRYCVPDVLFDRELKGEIGTRLNKLGLEIVELDSEEVTQSTRLIRDHRKLSVPDAFAFTVAHSRNWTLLTGDGELRRLAKGMSV